MPSIISEDTFGLVEVRDNSPLRHKNAVEKIAVYFRRETKYSFVQYSAEEPSGGTYEPYIPTVAFLFTNPNLLHYTKSGKSKIQTVGACCFREKEYKDIPNPVWELDWIWLHPYKRNEGFLNQYWNVFLYRFKMFFPRFPISKSMERFLIKQNHPLTRKSYFEEKKNIKK